MISFFCRHSCTQSQWAMVYESIPPIVYISGGLARKVRGRKREGRGISPPTTRREIKDHRHHGVFLDLSEDHQHHGVFEESSLATSLLVSIDLAPNLSVNTRVCLSWKIPCLPVEGIAWTLGRGNPWILPCLPCVLPRFVQCR
jgi:hypothetical protein